MAGRRLAPPTPRPSQKRSASLMCRPGMPHFNLEGPGAFPALQDASEESKPRKHYCPTAPPGTPTPSLPQVCFVPNTQKRGNATSHARRSLKSRIFQVCDVDRDGFLNREEMCKFARHMGFEDNDAEWQQEYSRVCRDCGVSEQEGLSESVIFDLLDDVSDKGTFCTDNELRRILVHTSVAQADNARLHDACHEEASNGSALQFAGAPRGASVGLLKGVFGQFGAVRDFETFVRRDGGWTGMGRCTYEGADDAAKAITTGLEVDGCKLFLEGDTVVPPPALRGKWPSQPGSWSSPRSAPYKRKNERSWQSETSKTVFFSNASFDSEEHAIRDFFKTSGRVKSCDLLRKPDGRFRGMGVVEYNTTAEAKRAFINLHKQPLDGRQLCIYEHHHETPQE